MKHTVKSDAIEIVKRLLKRNPDFKKCMDDGRVSLEDFAEIVIINFKGFNCIK